MRQSDPAYEALAEATSADMEGSRGELNRALKLIRDQTDAIGEHLASEIRTRALMYRQVMPDVMLTPTALAKHWQRLETEVRKQPPATNRTAQTGTDCETCGGDRMVLVQTRPAPNGAHEEYSCCPTCNPSNSSYYVMGRKVEALDPEQVLARMRQ
jgi:hypothetical protein